MGRLTICNLPDDVRAALRVRAAQAGYSMEAEARRILVDALRPVAPEAVSQLQELVARLYEGAPPTRVADELIAERRLAAQRVLDAGRAAVETVMSAKNTQVSATISVTTKEKLDRFTAELGLTKNFVVEQALLYFMASRRELPDEAYIPTCIVLDDEAFERLVAHLEAQPSPTAALRELMRDERP